MATSRYAQQLRQTLQERQDETAIDFSGVPFTWGQARRVAEAAEGILNDAGLPEGAKIGLLARNRPAHFAALWGIFIANRCVSMAYAFQPPEARAADLTKNRWPVVFAEQRDWTDEVIAAADAAGTVGYAFDDEGDAPFRRVTRNARPGAQADLEPDGDTVVQLLSSGTTGTPKRISLARKSIDDLIKRTIALFESGGSEARGMVQVMPWPLGSLGGTNAGLPCGVVGQPMAIQEKFDIAGILDQIRQYRPTFLGLPPSGFAMLMQLEPSKDDLSCVRMISVGSAPLDPIVHAKLEDHYGIPVGVCYGATEFAGLISGWLAADIPFMKAKRGSVGRALPEMQIRIVDRDDPTRILSTGEIGLLEAIVPRITDEWMLTNDLAYIDEDGFIFLEGRADDAIMRGGFKIIPEEVAAVLRTHPLVGDAALIGLPDERLGAVPVAVIEKRMEGEAPTPEDLEAYLRAKLPPFKVPARFVIVDAIPRTQTMKPRREGLLELFA